MALRQPLACIAPRYDGGVRPSPTHDPVSAPAESEATGATAEVFADIRASMSIPLVTSIWRVLAGITGTLTAMWDLAGPIVHTGQPDASLVRLRDEVVWPLPSEALAGSARKREVAQARTIVGAYTRSNTLSLLSLSALVTEAVGEPAVLTVPAPPGPWPELPPLRVRDEIDPDTWALIERVNLIGSTADQPGVATLWRHLAEWPELLAAIERGLGQLQDDGGYATALSATQSIVAEEAGRLAHLRPPDVTVPDEALTLVRPYVTHPGLVQRMVVIGHILARWFDSDEVPR